jgi:hypothetical protein
MTTINSLIERLNLMEQKIKTLEDENQKLKDQTKDYNELKKYIEKIKEPYIESKFFKYIYTMVKIHIDYSQKNDNVISKEYEKSLYEYNKLIMGQWDKRMFSKFNYLDYYYNDITSISKNTTTDIINIYLYKIFNNLNKHNLIKYRFILQIKKHPILYSNDGKYQLYNLHIQPELIDYVKNNEKYINEINKINKEIEQDKKSKYNKYVSMKNFKWIITILIEHLKNDFETTINQWMTTTINFNSNIELKNKLNIQIDFVNFRDIEGFISQFKNHFIINKLNISIINIIKNTELINKYTNELKDKNQELNNIFHNSELYKQYIEECSKITRKEEIIKGKKQIINIYTDKYKQIEPQIKIKQKQLDDSKKKKKLLYEQKIKNIKNPKTLIDINFNSYQEYIETDWIDYDESHKESIFPITFYNYCILDYIKLELYYQS